MRVTRRAGGSPRLPRPRGRRRAPAPAPSPPPTFEEVWAGPAEGGGSGRRGRGPARDERAPPHAHGAQRRGPRDARPRLRPARGGEARRRRARRGRGGVPQRGDRRARASRTATSGSPGAPAEGAARRRPERQRDDRRRRRLPRHRPRAGERPRPATVAWLLLAFAPRVDGRGRARARATAALLLHDIEEWLGPGRGARRRRSRSLLLLLLLPVVTFQGWGWLPLWWLALLFAYLGLGGARLVAWRSSASLAVGPAVTSLEFRLRTVENPLFRAGLAAVEGVPDGAAHRAARAGGGRATPRIATSRTCSARRASGPAATRRRPSSTAGMLAAYAGRRVRAEQPREPRVRARGVRQRARPLQGRHRVGRRAPRSRRPPTTTSRSRTCRSSTTRPTTRRARTPTGSRAGSWRATTAGSTTRGDYAVVDLGLQPEQVWAKFAGAASGVAARNVVAGGAAAAAGGGACSRSMANRFAGRARRLPAGGAPGGAAGAGRRRSPLHCASAAPPFCRRCHLGAGERRPVLAVLPPVRRARRRLGARAQPEDGRGAARPRRGGERVFRALSLAGSRRRATSTRAARSWGGSRSSAWYAVVGARSSPSRLVPFTEVSSRLVAAVVAGRRRRSLLAGTWLVANRLDAGLRRRAAVRRPAPRRARAGPGGLSDGPRRDDPRLRPARHLPAHRAAAEDRPPHAHEREGRRERHRRRSRTAWW